MLGRQLPSVIEGYRAYENRKQAWGFSTHKIGNRSLIYRDEHVSYPLFVISSLYHHGINHAVEERRHYSTGDRCTWPVLSNAIIAWTYNKFHDISRGASVV